MEILATFFEQFGLASTIIAIIGIMLLGVMKYCNLFRSLEESTRHRLYVLISVLLTLLGCTVYTIIIGQFNLQLIIAMSPIIYALNQAFYSIFSVTPLKNIIATLLTKYLNFKREHSD
jgi:hypothetical protein